MTPIERWKAADEKQRQQLVDDYLSRSASLVRDALSALQLAGLDVAVPDASLPEPVVAAEVALRHRNLIGRVDGFGPGDYAEMVASVRSVLGEVHPDDAHELASFDLWETQDRWTGEAVRTATRLQRLRGQHALTVLRVSAAAATG